MKRLILALAVVSMLAIGNGVAQAADPALDEYEDSITHPLRRAYYVVHPAGFALEWLVGRPFHYLISRPYLDQFFGSEPHEEYGLSRRYSEML